MMKLTPEALDEYTVFLAKYGKYIVDEISHFQRMAKLVVDLQEEYMHTISTNDSSQNSLKEEA